LASADRVALRHPLARSAVYRAASPGARRPVHGALAAATDPLIDPERRAWHRAQATLGPDECIAAELERLAGRAKARGGYAAAGAFLERSAELTLDREPRSGRTIAAAEAKYTAGTFDVAQRLAAAAEACPLDDLQRARLDLLHARIAFKSGRWRGSDVPSLFLTAARNFERVELPLAREIYLEALSAALVKAGTSDAERRGAGQALTMIQWAAAVLYNSLGRYDEALVVARQAGDGLLAHCFVGLSIVEEVEAATRSGQPEAAAAALSRFAEHARACGTDWALGVEARSRALVGRGDAAEHGYRQAIERLAAHRSSWTSPAPSCSTASGCAASSGGATPETSFAPPASASTPSGRRHSRSGPAANSTPPACSPANAHSHRARPFPRRRR
jgi:tetratricopeptide (TPR) repeat protein